MKKKLTLTQQFAWIVTHGEDTVYQTFFKRFIPDVYRELKKRDGTAKRRKK